MNPRRILHFPGIFTSGGVETVLMNWYRNIDRTKVQFDFCVTRSTRCPIDDEVEALGGRIIYTPRIRKEGVVKSIVTIKEVIIDNGPYEAVHIHSVHAGVVFLMAAWYAGIKKRVYHVHSTQDLALSKTRGEKIIECISKRLICKYSSHRLACSTDAGRYVYGRESFQVLNNAIDLNRFYPWDEAKKREIREYFGFSESDIVVGYVARFVEGKNHDLLLKVAERARSASINMKFLLVGDGDTRTKIEEAIMERGLTSYFVIPGFIQETEKVYNSLNIFCIPSKFEGFSLVTLEAQACGLPCLISDGVPQEVNLGITKVLQEKLCSDASLWLEDLLNLYGQVAPDASSIRQCITRKGYEITSIVKGLENLYLN